MAELIVLSVILLAVWVGSALAMHWLCRQIAAGRLERNTWVGTRTSWTLASDEAWHAAHRASLPAYRWAAWLSTAAAAATAVVAAAGVVGVVTPETGVAAQGIVSLVVCVAVLVVVLASLRPARRAVDALGVEESADRAGSGTTL